MIPMNTFNSTSNNTTNNHRKKRHQFPLWAQFSCVLLYFSFDLILRFCYQAVLDGNSLLQLAGTRTDKADESYEIETSSYNKPFFVVLCCYTTFILWGPLVVFPYLYFYRPADVSSIVEYYTHEWCAELSFRQAFLYTCGMGIILYLGNLGYVSGLRYISVALGSALSQGEAPLTVFLSVMVLGRCFETWEKRGIALSLMGIALIAIPPLLWKSQQEQQQQQGSDEYDDGDDYMAAGASSSSFSSSTTSWEQEVGGVISTFLGAFGFGAYQVFWPFFYGQRYISTTSSLAAVAPTTTPIHAVMDTLATLTLLGFFLLSTGWILLLFLHITGLETFEIPPKEIRGTLLVSSILSAMTDALNGVACVVASTVVVALAYPLIIPLSVLLQWWVDGIPPSQWGALGWIGTVLVVVGVFCLEATTGDGGGGSADGDMDKQHRNSSTNDEQEEDDDDGIMNMKGIVLGIMGHYDGGRNDKEGGVKEYHHGAGNESNVAFVNMDNMTKKTAQELLIPRTITDLV
jgi:hypothetical protein